MAADQNLTDVLEAVKHWPPDARVSLARMILETVESPATGESAAASSKSSRRGKPVEQLIGIGAGSAAPPSDQQVRHWIDEQRVEKYGP